MVFSQDLLLDYGSLQRLSLFLSCSALPLHYSLHCSFLLLLDHSSTLPVPLIGVGVCSCEEKRVSELML